MNDPLEHIGRMIYLPGIHGIGQVGLYYPQTDAYRIDYMSEQTSVILPMYIVVTSENLARILELMNEKSQN